MKKLEKPDEFDLMIADLNTLRGKLCFKMNIYTQQYTSDGLEKYHKEVIELMNTFEVHYAEYNKKVNELEKNIGI